MRRRVLALVCLASCTMPNPAFEDGSIADEGAGSDDRVETSDSVDESGSGSGDSSTSEADGESSTSSTDATESGPIDSSSESEGESSSGTTDTTEGESSTGPIDTSDTESGETGGLLCLELVPADDCQACQIESCCTDLNFECFDPEAPDDCMCLLGCLSLGNLINLCGIQCGAGMLLSSIADSTYDCIVEACGQSC